MLSLTSPTDTTVAQRPPWDDPAELAAVVDTLASRPALVGADGCHTLRGHLARVAAGEAFVLQGGDCAERFSASSSAVVSAKAAQLRRLDSLLGAHGGPEGVLIGRLAGQYAKPRSRPTETTADGTVLPVYRGDAVNDPAPSAQARRADPQRLLRAYDHAAEVLSALESSSAAPGDRWTASVSADVSTREKRIFTSHEALLLDYERPLVRRDSLADGWYGSSAHMLWVGERTRAPGSAHVDFARRLNNPVGVKLGPTASPAQVRELCERFTRDGPGRLVLISRMGRDAVAHALPPLLEAAGPFAGRVVWLCDPMHGNTLSHVSGRKSRVVADVAEEGRLFFTVLRRHGVHPGGLHLELTPSAVTECVDEPNQLQELDALDRYESACDPRLNPEQAEELVAMAAMLL